MRKLIKKVFGDPEAKTLKRLNKRLPEINALEEKYQALDQDELKKKISDFRKQVQDKKVELDDILHDVFAIVRETAKREVNMRPFDVQLIGGIVLHEGSVAEMRTGEGKTLVATMPMVLNALEGKGTHLVTVNDYLAQRDAGWMGKVYNALGMSIGVIMAQKSYIYDDEFENEDHDDERFLHLKPCTRQEAYAADITYGTNNEFGFDYLRDNMVRESSQLRQRELHYAIVDEVDSILIDEARTPLIISAAGTRSGSNYSRFARIVKKLKEEDYEVDEKRRSATLTDEGVLKVQQELGIENLYAPEYVSYIYHLEQALKAETLFKRDKDYVVTDDGEVIIVDEFTGRMMHGRRYNEGLHQAIEAKEGVEVQQESMTLATISFQNYFRLYDKLAGMTGTAETEKEEFYQIYELDVVVIPTNEPVARVDRTDLIFKSQQAKYKAIVNKVKELNDSGQPVLIGTASIEKNEYLSNLLGRAGIDHNVLNAKNNEGEAAVVSKAGQAGAVTLATNIAGRGTDIVLGEGVVEKGGLFVLGSERHESRRIDNQLRGRTGRQGDPGETQFFVAADDDLMRIFGGDRIGSLMNRMGVDEDTPIENKALSRALETAQKKVENHNFDARKRVVQYDDVMNRHRKSMYSLRRGILMSEDVEEQITEAVSELVGAFKPSPGSQNKDLIEELQTLFNLDQAAAKKLSSAGDEKFGEQLQNLIKDKLAEQHKNFGDDVFKKICRDLYLQVLDSMWMQHLESMDHLREGIKWRQVGQKDPLVEYRREGQRMFDEMQLNLKTEVIRGLAHAQPISEEARDEPVETELTRAARQAVATGSQPASNADSSDAKVKIQRRTQGSRRAEQRQAIKRNRGRQRRSRRKSR